MGRRRRARVYLRRLQDFAPAAGEEGDCDLRGGSTACQPILLLIRHRPQPPPIPLPPGEAPVCSRMIRRPKLPSFLPSLLHSTWAFLCGSCPTPPLPPLRKSWNEKEIEPHSPQRTPRLSTRSCSPAPSTHRTCSSAHCQSCPAPAVEIRLRHVVRRRRRLGRAWVAWLVWWMFLF